jgi:hypothetical protein
MFNWQFCLGRVPALRDDFQPNQKAAVRAQHRIWGPNPEKIPFPSAC